MNDQLKIKPGKHHGDKQNPNRKSLNYQAGYTPPPMKGPNYVKTLRGNSQPPSGSNYKNVLPTSSGEVSGSNKHQSR